MNQSPSAIRRLTEVSHDTDGVYRGGRIQKVLKRVRKLVSSFPGRMVPQRIELIIKTYTQSTKNI